MGELDGLIGQVEATMAERDAAQQQQAAAEAAAAEAQTSAAELQVVRALVCTCVHLCTCFNRAPRPCPAFDDAVGANPSVSCHRQTVSSFNSMNWPDTHGSHL